MKRGKAFGFFKASIEIKCRVNWRNIDFIIRLIAIAAFIRYRRTIASTMKNVPNLPFMVKDPDRPDFQLFRPCATNLSQTHRKLSKSKTHWFLTINYN